MGRGAVIVVSVLLAALGVPSSAIHAQTVVIPVLPVEPGSKLPPVLTGDALPAIPGAGPNLPAVPVVPPTETKSQNPLPGLPPIPNFDVKPTDPLPGSTLLPIPNVEIKPSDPLPGSTRTSLQPGTIRDVPPPPGGANPAPRAELLLPDGSGVVLPEAAKQTIRFGPRYGKLNDYTVDKQRDGTQRITYSGGLKVTVLTLSDKSGTPPQEMEFSADNVVIWVRGVKSSTDILGSGLEVDRTPAKDDGKEASKNEKVTVELYMSGNVVIRTMGVTSAPGTSAFSGPSQQIIRADEIYYDVDKNKAIALNGDMETKFQSGADSIHLRGREIWRLGPREWRAYDTSLFSSKRPADPALTLTSREATLTQEEVVKRNIFGIPYRSTKTGEVDVSDQQLLTAYQNRVRVLGLPVFALPRYKADMSDPAGPLNAFLIRSGNVFGVQYFTTWDIYKLLAFRPPPFHQWLLNLDYMSLRGPAVGTTYNYRNAFFGPDYQNTGSFNAYVIHDHGLDLLGGYRGIEPDSSSKESRTRARVAWQHNQAIYEDGTDYIRAAGQFVYLSDKNFFEQYYKQQFDMDPNQETFAQVFGAMGNISWSALGQVNVDRPWITETNWLPRGDAAISGQSFLYDRAIYSSHVTGGYAQFNPASQSPISTLPTEQRALNTGYADWNQRVGVPIDAGPFRFEPYALADLTAYSQTLSGSDQGRAYGALGIRASIPFSKLYPDISSELLNIRGINHKITAGANYFAGYASSSASNYPLLNRLNDDNLDLTYRTWNPLATLYTPGPGGLALQNSPLFNPQNVGLRRLVDDRPETLDTIQVLQLSLQQRWQTKRGLPGADHTVDWMSLDLSASIFPNASRDNYGSTLGFLEYNYIWNVGDRTAISSSAWVDPISQGAKYFNIGGWYNRPDGSNLYVGYRYTDPVNSRALIVSLGYQLSTKYSVSATNVFDFGTNLAQSTQLTFNRTGTDLTMSFGFSFSALVPGNNVGFQFLLMPNAALASSSAARAIGPLAATGVR